MISKSKDMYILHIQMYFIVSMVDNKCGTFIGKCDFNINRLTQCKVKQMYWNVSIGKIDTVHVICKCDFKINRLTQMPWRVSYLMQCVTLLEYLIRPEYQNCLLLYLLVDTCHLAGKYQSHYISPSP